MAESSNLYDQLESLTFSENNPISTTNGQQYPTMDVTGLVYIDEPKKRSTEWA